MRTGGYLLTNSEMLNEWILKEIRICVATKRGLSGSPFFIWTEKGTTEYNVPLTHIIFNELKNNVDIVWLGSNEKKRLASVILSEDQQLIIESCSYGWLDGYYNSYLNN